MPYIKDNDKEYLDKLTLGTIAKLFSYQKCLPKGWLTYTVYYLARYWFKSAESYSTISQAISCLNDAAAEIRRRYLDPYEDKMREINGDVE